jgi:hypothetical protein
MVRRRDAQGGQQNGRSLHALHFSLMPRLYFLAQGVSTCTKQGVKVVSTHPRVWVGFLVITAMSWPWAAAGRQVVFCDGRD